VWADEGRAVAEPLRRAAQGDVVLAEAMLTLAHYQEEQARTAAALLERETWVLTAILERSAPIWRYLPTATLRFALDPPGATHLELGHFSHLAPLVTPRADEPAVIATTPRWARVSTRPKEQHAEQTGAFVHTYMPISVTEAVATLGLGRILTQLELATRTAGQALLTQAQAQRERQAQIRRAEHMLGYESETAQAVHAGTRALPALLLLLLMGPAGLLALGGVLWALMLVMVCFLFGIPAALLTLLLGSVGLLVWRWRHATGIMNDPW
jgi:hypothetical protein